MTRRKFSLERLVAKIAFAITISTAGCFGAAVSSNAQTGGSQTVTSQAGGVVASTSTTIPESIVLSVNHDIATGFNQSNQPLGPQRTVVTIINKGPETRFNEQMVVRFGQRPDVIYAVRDASNSIVGVIDGPSSTWFHTIAVLSPGSKLVFTVTWNKVCPGRWALGARVGDTLNWQLMQWIGPSTPKDGCPPDEVASPTTPALPWPAAFPPPPAISPIIVPAAGDPTPTATPKTIAIAAATTVAPTTTLVPAPAVAQPKTSTTSTVLLCRTIGDNRVCEATADPAVLSAAADTPSSKTTIKPNAPTTPTTTAKTSPSKPTSLKKTTSKSTGKKPSTTARKPGTSTTKAA